MFLLLLISIINVCRGPFPGASACARMRRVREQSCSASKQCLGHPEDMIWHDMIQYDIMYDTTTRYIAYYMLLWFQSESSPRQARGEGEVHLIIISNLHVLIITTYIIIVIIIISSSSSIVEL